jgi:hypothetical protein
MVQTQNGTALFIFSMEGPTQGNPLAMFIYGMGLLPLIRRLKGEVDDVSQPWYADDAGAGGKFDQIKVYFGKLEEYGSKYGYFPEASKSILIVREHNAERAKEYFAEMKFTIKTGYRYLEGFVGARAEMNEWIGEKADEWTAGIKAIAKVSPQFPQTAYAGWDTKVTPTGVAICTESYRRNWKRIFRGRGSSDGSTPPCSFWRNSASWHPFAEDHRIASKSVGVEHTQCQAFCYEELFDVGGLLFIFGQSNHGTGNLESFGSQSDTQASSRGSSNKLNKLRRNHSDRING